MIIESERLVLRPFLETDGADLYEYLSDPEVTKYEPYRPFSREDCEQEAKNRAANPNFIAVTLGGKVIGNIYLEKTNAYTYDIGWVFSRAHQGKGYATEAARAVMDWAFQTQGAWRIFARCDPRNAASWKLMERLGMRRESWMRKNVYFFTDENGAPLWKDTYEYAVLKEEWQ